MFSDQAPVTSVVVEYRLPVSVFCAVTVTPGSEMLPLFTAPCSLPPATAPAATESVGFCVDGAGAEALGGEELCAAEAGACDHATTAATVIPNATAHVAACRICAPCHRRLVLSQTFVAP